MKFCILVIFEDSVCKHFIVTPTVALSRIMVALGAETFKNLIGTAFLINLILSQWNLVVNSSYKELIYN